MRGGEVGIGSQSGCLLGLSSLGSQGQQLNLLNLVLKFTHVGLTVNGDIFIKQPQSTQYNLTHIHGDHITPNLVLTMIEIDWNKTSLFDLKYCEINPRHFEWVEVGIISNPRFSHSLDDIALIQLSLSTITLQLLFPILVNVWKVAFFSNRLFSRQRGDTFNNIQVS